MIANNTLLVPRIESRIQVIRGLRVMLDVDLSALYGVQTKRLNEQVKRNRDRFPTDFLFQLTADEKTEVVANCDHLQNLKFSKALPFAFTEHGAIQAANVLASSQAVEMGIYVVQAFVQLRQALATNADVAKRLAELEMKTESLEMSHDNFSRNTRLQLRQLLDAVREPYPGATQLVRHVGCGLGSDCRWEFCLEIRQGIPHYQWGLPLQSSFELMKNFLYVSERYRHGFKRQSI